MLIAALSSIKGSRIRWNALGIRESKLYQIFFDSIINQIEAGIKIDCSVNSGTPTRLETRAPPLLFGLLALAESA